MRRKGWAAVGVVAAGCFYKPAPPSDQAAIDAAVLDATVPDAGTCVQASAECLGGTVLRSCSGAGVASIDTTCGWGCNSAGTPHCGTIVPAGGAVTSADLDPTGVTAMTVAGAVIDGDAGTIAGISAAGFRFRIGSGVAIFAFKSLEITGTVTLAGAHPIALVADGIISIGGQLDVRGPCTGNAAGPGGGAGGNGLAPGGGMGGGAAGSTGQGGGGGGYGGVGGRGGKTSGGGPAGGVAFGAPAITVLVGGGGGGGGGDSARVGGGGGGAIQLVSNGAISVAGTINAGGCGGHGATTSSAGGGGGAGGTILLEAPQVTISGHVAVNGGGGGGGDLNSGDGSPGTADRVAAAGGTYTSGVGAGGQGAAGATFDGSEGGGSSKSGGGGGALGRIRITTRTGAVTTIGAIMSPALSDPSSRATAAPANVQ
jgi:hypothetical protein